jgi:XXXCH domain-containing protein
MVIEVKKGNGETLMLESKEKMSQSFSDLKVALEKGRGTPQEIFPVFEKACQAFCRETNKVPADSLQSFLELTEQLGKRITAGDNPNIFNLLDDIRALKKTCHEKYKK